jgi:TPR repeat protein
MEITFLAAAYVLHGPESFAFAVIALIFATWRGWVREWQVHLLYLLPFALVWPLITRGYVALQTKPIPPDVASLGPWVSIAAAVLWAYLAKELWHSISRREQRASRWWLHAFVLGASFGVIGGLSAYLARLAQPSETIVLTDADMERIRAGGALVEREGSSSAEPRTRVEILGSMTTEELTQLANAGDADAQSELGFRLYDGTGVPVDQAAGFSWILKAAEQGRAVDQWNVGAMYETGMGVAVDPAAAAAWWERAANQGIIDAQIALGDKYNDGLGVPRNAEKAAEWYRKAADQGNRVAQRKLATAYLQGRGVPQNFETALALYKLAANQNDGEAQTQLGFLYEFGTGVAKNPQLAAEWYLKAAEQGIPGAQNNLGNLYMAGDGVPRNQQQAYFWYLLASAAGYSAAVTNRDNIEAQLTPQQRAEAQRDASAWKAKAAPQ